VDLDGAARVGELQRLARVDPAASSAARGSPTRSRAVAASERAAAEAVARRAPLSVNVTVQPDGGAATKLTRRLKLR
jgi:hypothetical protein